MGNLAIKQVVVHGKEERKVEMKQIIKDAILDVLGKEGVGELWEVEKSQAYRMLNGKDEKGKKVKLPDIDAFCEALVAAKLMVISDTGEYTVMTKREADSLRYLANKYTGLETENNVTSIENRRSE